MTADEAIADLDDDLDANGEIIMLQRLTLMAGRQVPCSVTLRAFVRGYAPTELADGITQQDVKIILSPTAIDRRGWPGPAIRAAGAAAVVEDPRVPRAGDRAITSRGRLTVQAGAGLYIGDRLVRLELQARGRG